MDLFPNGPLDHHRGQVCMMGVVTEKLPINLAQRLHHTLVLQTLLWVNCGSWWSDGYGGGDGGDVVWWWWWLLRGGCCQWTWWPLSISSNLSQAKGAVYAYWGVYQGARAQHEEDDDGDDDDFADKAVWGVHHQRGRVHQEASGKDIYGDGQHFSANSSLVGMSNVSKKHCRCRWVFHHHLSIRSSCCISLNFLIIFLIAMTYDTSEGGDVDDGVPATL